MTSLKRHDSLSVNDLKTLSYIDEIGKQEALLPFENDIFRALDRLTLRLTFPRPSGGASSFSSEPIGIASGGD